MACAPPSAADLAARFPTFAVVPTGAVTGAIAEALTRVDSTWTEGDFRMGVLLYAAHLLTLDGLGTGAEAALAAAGGLGFTSLHAGTLALGRPGPGPETGPVLGATTYGRRFLALLRVNQPAVLVP